MKLFKKLRRKKIKYNKIPWPLLDYPLGKTSTLYVIRLVREQPPLEFSPEELSLIEQESPHFQVPYLGSGGMLGWKYKLSKETVSFFDNLFTGDYMGAAEYEWGLHSLSIRMIVLAARLKKLIVIPMEVSSDPYEIFEVKEGNLRKSKKENPPIERKFVLLTTEADFALAQAISSEQLSGSRNFKYNICPNLRIHLFPFEGSSYNPQNQATASAIKRASGYVGLLAATPLMLLIDESLYNNVLRQLIEVKV